MGWFALVIAMFGGMLAAFPHPALYFGMALGVCGIGVGLLAYRRREMAAASNRLAAAAGMAVGILAFILCATRYTLTLVAMHRLEGLF